MFNVNYQRDCQTCVDTIALLLWWSAMRHCPSVKEIVLDAGLATLSKPFQYFVEQQANIKTHLLQPLRYWLSRAYNHQSLIIDLIIVTQELLLNGGDVAPMKPFSQQMGVADKYAMDAARMAMSHPAMLDHADRPHVQFGSVAQFRVGTQSSEYKGICWWYFFSV